MDRASGLSPFAPRPGEFVLRSTYEPHEHRELPPEEILMSDSQERMMAIVRASDLDAFLDHQVAASARLAPSKRLR